MDTKKLIRMGKEGDLIPTELRFLGPEKAKIYSQLMAIFLKQGVIFDKAYIERRGDGLSLTINGAAGNMMFYHRNIEFEENKTKFPVNGDFMLEATSNKEKEEKILNKIAKTRATNANRTTPTISLSGTGRGRGRRYSAIVPSYDSTKLPTMDIGISCIRIPIISSRVLHSTHKIKGLTTLSATGNMYRPDRSTDEWLEKNGETQSFPLMTHVAINASNYNYTSVRCSNLIYSQKESIVKKVLPNKYDTTNIVCLYEMPLGTTHTLMKKANKKAPFGRLEISYSNTKQETKLAYKVVNLDNTESVSVESREPIYRDKSHEKKGVISIDYGSWFDTAKTHRSGSSSFNNITPLSGKLNLVGEIECTELLGISKTGKIVYGLKYTILRKGVKDEEIIAMSTIGQHDIALDFDEGIFDVKVTKPKKRGRPKKKVAVEKPEVKEEIPIELVDSSIYKKWREISDTWYKERDMPTETSVIAVFNAYLNSAEEITDEDIKEFNRLK